MNFLEDLFKKDNLLAKIISLVVACFLWAYVMMEQNPIVERYYEVPLQQRDVAETMAVFNAPEVVTVQVKEAWSRYTAINYSPEKVHRLLRDGAEAALKKLPEIPCLPMEKHYGMTKHFMCPNQAFPLEMTGGKRLDECTVQFESDDLIDLVAQSYGWAAGVHNRKYGISPEWVFRG